MYDYKNGYDEVVDDNSICEEQSSCENCPNFDECYDISNEVQDDYETMEPDEFLEKYL